MDARRDTSDPAERILTPTLEKVASRADQLPGPAQNRMLPAGPQRACGRVPLPLWLPGECSTPKSRVSLAILRNSTFPPVPQRKPCLGGCDGVGIAVRCLYFMACGASGPGRCRVAAFGAWLVRAVRLEWPPLT